MPLSPGDKLGPYEIVAQIGAGGMGVVYRAHDARVGRDVAVKVLTERFSDRFEREARAVASLSHANICTLHDVGSNYLVMELIEGEPPKGPLPLDTALHYARQIADALDAAHEKGIVHRDLKPANIKIRSDGTVKVLDFGLAKVTVEGKPTEDLSNSPTMPVEGTVVGTILGTAAYMSPEQARGKPVDKRADVWAFGVVLYEMVTGRRAFEGDDVSTIIGAVIHSEPRWDGVPAKVRPLLESCLEKDPRRRLRDIGDAWKLLDDRPSAVVSSSRGYAGWIAAAALAAIAAVALWAPWRSEAPTAARSAIRLDVDLGPDVSLPPLDAPTFSSLIISPDGTRIVFDGSPAGGPRRLMVRRLDQSQITELPGTQGAMNPFFSPDGQWVAFWDRQRIAKISIDGGSVVPVVDMPTMTGGSWTDDRTMVIGTGIPGTAGVIRVPASGGAASALTKLASGEMFQTSPYLVRRGEVILISTVNSPPSLETCTIDAITMADGQRKTLIRGAVGERYLPSGHLLYAQGSTLLAVAVDLERLELRGTPVAVLHDVAVDLLAWRPQYDVSRDGTLVYRRNPAAAASQMKTIQWVDTSGKFEPLLPKPGAYLVSPRISPDGKRVAFIMRDGPNQDAYVYDIRRDDLTRLTFGGAAFSNPVWTRDGRYVILGSLGNGLFWAPADGGRGPQPLVPGQSVSLPSSLTADGKYLTFMRADGIPQIWTVELREEAGALHASTPVQFLRSSFVDNFPSFSPDGRWLAYQSNESGTFEVYVRPFPPIAQGASTKVKISNGGGEMPAWLPGTSELIYRAGSQMMAAKYTILGDAFLADKPSVWGRIPADVSGYDPAPDGKRLAMIFSPETRETSLPHGIVVVQNFFEELRRRVPVTR